MIRSLAVAVLLAGCAPNVGEWSGRSVATRARTGPPSLVETYVDGDLRCRARGELTGPPLRIGVYDCRQVKDLVRGSMCRPPEP